MESAEVTQDAAPIPSLGWRAAGLSLAVALLVLLALFRGTAGQIIAIWFESSTYGYGMLVVPVAAFLAWERRDRLRGIAPRPFPAGLILLFGFSLLWLAGDLAGIDIVQHFALVLMVQSLVWTILGTRTVRAMFVPIAFLLFAVPFGEVFVPLLQQLTAWLLETTVRLSGVPIWREELLIYIPGRSWYVAEACGGMRFVLPAIALGIAYAAITYRTPLRRVVFLLICIVAPIVANSARAYAIVVLSHLGNESELAAQLADAIHFSLGHQLLGLVLFLAMLMLIFWIGWFWRQAPAPPPASPPDPVVPTPPRAFGRGRGARGPLRFAQLRHRDGNRGTGRPRTRDAGRAAPAPPLDDRIVVAAGLGSRLEQARGSDQRGLRPQRPPRSAAGRDRPRERLLFESPRASQPAVRRRIPGTSRRSRWSACAMAAGPSMSSKASSRTTTGSS